MKATSRENRTFRKIAIILVAIFWTSQTAIQPSSAAESYKSIQFTSCTSSNNKICIEDISAELPNGTVVSATPAEHSTSVNCGNVSGISTQCTIMEMRIPGLKNEDGNNLIQVVGWIQPPNSTNTDLPPGAIVFFISTSGWAATKSITTGKCATRAAELHCLASYDLQSDVRFTAKLRIGDFQPAWTTGTLKNSTVTFEKTNNGNVITYAGASGQSAGIISDPKNNGLPETSNDFETNMWSIRTIDSNDVWGDSLRARGCTGLNPTMMSDALWLGLPSFSSDSDEISLQVNNPHFLSTGQPAVGHFEGLFPADFVKCYWNKTLQDANNHVQLQITYPDEAPVLATLVTNVSAGGLNILASGYHYSSPTLKISMISPKTETSKADPSPTPAPSKAPAPTVIKCSNGKKTITLTGKRKSCPLGYKKK